MKIFIDIILIIYFILYCITIFSYMLTIKTKQQKDKKIPELNKSIFGYFVLNAISTIFTRHYFVISFPCLLYIFMNFMNIKINSSIRLSENKTRYYNSVVHDLRNIKYNLSLKEYLLNSLRNSLKICNNFSELQIIQVTYNSRINSLLLKEALYCGNTNKNTNQNRYKHSSKNKPNNKVSECLKILGLTTANTKEDVKKRYKLLAKKHHPDLGGNKETFVKINNAYTYIKDYFNIV